MVFLLVSLFTLFVFVYWLILYLQHYLAWFRYIDSKEYENTASNKENMLVKSCLFITSDAKYYV
ncbi:hypothetical protein ASL11_34355 [Paenibacillus sp. Soil750]|nr:hypothetical protein ASL11_34355 [Paenibacillus sp. Soil750]